MDDLLKCGSDIEKRRNHYRYRDCAIYPKPTKDKKGMSGEITIDNKRVWVPQHHDIDAMLSTACLIVDRALSPQPDVINAWFRMKLV